MSINREDKLYEQFLENSVDRLHQIESALLAMEKSTDEELAAHVALCFREIHSIKGEAGYLGDTDLHEVSAVLEEKLETFRSNNEPVSEHVISCLLKINDALSRIVDHNKAGQVDLNKDVREEINGYFKAMEHGDAGPSSQPTIENDLSNDEDSMDTISLGYQGKVLVNLEEAKIKALKEEDHEFYAVVIPTSLQDSDDLGGILELISHHCEVLFDSSLGSNSSQLSQGERVIVCATKLFEENFADLLPFSDAQYYCYAGSRLESQGNLKNFATKPKREESVVPPVESTKSEKEVVQSQPKQKVAEPPTMPKQAPTKKEVTKMKPKEQEAGKVKVTGPTGIRVNVTILDKLMNLAGELVLSRNELGQVVSDWDRKAVEASLSRLNAVTSELQETIMATRMQPIKKVFEKSLRLVRDLSESLGKECKVIFKGEDVELDKKIIEAISDPFVHLIRNSMDHGLELPEARVAAGKPRQGTIRLTAQQQASQVLVTIEDDGNGIDPEKIKQKALSKGLIAENDVAEMSDAQALRLILLPGFSTAQEVTDISGRGVGMDVVQSNITSLGGTLNVNSNYGESTTFTIKLPLTLAIIPSLLVESEEVNFVIPQSNLFELVRVPPNKVDSLIEKVGNLHVIRIRGRVVPLVDLKDFIGVKKPTYFNQQTNSRQIDKRRPLADHETDHDVINKRINPQGSINIAVVGSGQFKFGLIVEKLLDTEEIVVKPLGRHIRNTKGYAGATILGDGSVALILDVAGIGRKMKLELNENLVVSEFDRAKAQHRDVHYLLVFENANNERYAVSLESISRIERFTTSEIKSMQGKKYVKYRNGTLVLFNLKDALNCSDHPPGNRVFALIHQVGGQEVGLLVSSILDVIEFTEQIERNAFTKRGVLGTAVIMDQVTSVIDINQIGHGALKGQIGAVADDKTKEVNSLKKILLVEDSPFFQTQIKESLEDEGYEVILGEDGQIGLSLLHDNHDVDLILSDIEMPNLNGYEFAKKVRCSSQYQDLPMIALTSLAGQDNVTKGLDAGFNEHLVKFDRTMVLSTLKKYLKK